MNITFGRRGIAVLLVSLVVLTIVPSVAVAETRAGGTIVVEEGTTIDSLQAFGGSVIIRGTVTGDVQVFSGSVVVAETGQINGKLEVAAGSLTIAGQVDGNVQAATGSVVVEESGVIAGDLRAGAETVTIQGTVQGTVEAGSETLRLGSSAVVQGDVRYGTDTNFVREEGATVTGQTVAVDDLQVNVGIGPVPIPNVGSWLVTLYGALFMIIVGALLLAAFPGFTAGVADRVATTPLRSAGTGLIGVIGVLAVVVALFITIIGIPLAVIGLLLFALAVIAAVALGQYAIGAWTLSLADIENKWAALVVGVLLITVLSRLPYIGWVFDLGAFALGFGALLLGLLAVWRGRGEEPTPSDDGGSAESTTG